MLNHLDIRREVHHMERARKGLFIALIGVFLFVLSFFALLNAPDLYLLSLVLMFVAVVLIGLGSAVAKGFDSSLDSPTDDCYYCKGTGRIGGPDGSETCPRCGGTGLARADD